jgi:hypothetical protein
LALRRIDSAIALTLDALTGSGSVATAASMADFVYRNQSWRKGCIGKVFHLGSPNLQCGF